MSQIDEVNQGVVPDFARGGRGHRRGRGRGVDAVPEQNDDNRTVVGRGQVRARGRARGRARECTGRAAQTFDVELESLDNLIGEPESSDDETAKNKKKPTLIAEGSRYGYKLASGAFIFKSNFILKVKSEIQSDKYPNLKGHTWNLKLAPSARYPNGSLQEIFIPKSSVKDPKLVEAIIDKQTKGTIDMDFEKAEWKGLVRKLVDEFDSDSVGYSWKKFVEMVGLQVHTLRETGELHFVFGPDCAFKDLSTDNNPVHYWYANLSLHPRENAKLFPVK